MPAKMETYTEGVVRYAGRQSLSGNWRGELELMTGGWQLKEQKEETQIREEDYFLFLLSGILIVFFKGIIALL
jgi:hypothetical protein